MVEGEPPVATMPAEAAREAFYGSCNEEQVTWALERIRPQALAPSVTPLTLGGGASGDVARSYGRPERSTAVLRRGVSRTPLM